MSSLAKLVIVAADGARRTYALHRYPVVVGRDEGCDITIVASEQVAGRHVRIEQSLLTGLPILVDLASGAPTLYHGDQIDRYEIQDRDVFQLADVQLIFYMPMPAVTDGTPHLLEILSGPEQGTTLPVGPEEVTIGRRSANRMPVSMKDVSGFHARFRMVEGVPTVEDLGSRNGTFVNGFRLEPSKLQALQAGDLVDLASMGVMVRPTVVPKWTQDSGVSSDSDSEGTSSNGAASSASSEELNLLPSPRSRTGRRRSGTTRVQRPAPRTNAPSGDEAAEDDNQTTPYLMRRARNPDEGGGHHPGA